MAKQQVANIYDGMEQYGSGYSNWASLLMKIVNDFYQVVVAGHEAIPAALGLQKHYLPRVLFAGGSNATLPITHDKKGSDKTMHFVCYDGTCLLPTEDEKEVLKMIAR
jgi:uncharacterized protein YyaL (SSP411 family)